MPARIAVVGDFDPRNRTHAFTSDALEHVGLGFEWVGTEAIGANPGKRLGGFHGVFIAPASPYRSMEGALSAIRWARERSVPLVGT